MYGESAIPAKMRRLIFNGAAAVVYAGHTMHGIQHSSDLLDYVTSKRQAI